ncbi:MAG: hypothetical protein CL561_00395 [Alphaproteobacteria bacterium]|nr:hypothetical protein [Alphaproteobacteria bacterium]|tara:strand:+ start:26113 stop:26508 length:396 start_codon:yes stop_codon:yes gene_type:complete
MKIIFAPQPSITPVKESNDLYVLDKDYHFTIEMKGYKRRHVIKKGFKYDGASVPLWGVFLIGLQRDGIHRAAALIHDWIYTNKGECGKHYYTKKLADKIFYKVMKYHGVKSLRAKAAYLAVKCAFWKDWER